MFKIGHLVIPGPLVLAPMAGFTNAPMRQISHQYGADLVYTEMVSDLALIHNNEQTRQMINDFTNQGIVAVQLFGHRPETMAQAAQIAVSLGAQIIDINFGCPAPKIVKSGSGSALLKDLDRAVSIAAAVVAAVSVPVTAKLRLGFSAPDAYLPLAQALEQVGIKALALHPRTRQMQFLGLSDWAHIKLLKAAVTIPVIGNGDVKTPRDVLRMLAETGCDAVMIGRASIGNPWIFAASKAALAGTSYPEVTLTDRITLIRRHLALMPSVHNPLALARPLVGYYLKGFEHASKYRAEIMRCQSFAEIEAVLDVVIASQLEVD